MEMEVKIPSMRIDLLTATIKLQGFYFCLRRNQE